MLKKLNQPQYWLLLILILFCSIGFGMTSCQKQEDNVVYLYNWGEYLDPEVKEKFYEETGIKVIEDNFVQNEDMYMKLASEPGNYDLVVPSDYMIERMIKDDMVQPIHYEHLKNFKNIDPKMLHKDFDPEQKYSVPYFWGTVGIVYNKKMVDHEDLHWSDLFDPCYKDEIIMMDSMRDTIGVALLKEGYSMNEHDPDALKKAKQVLIAQKPLVLAYLVDETKSLMINGEAALALMYSGDAIIALQENEDLGYVIPTEGTNLWFDSLVIPKGARHVKNAEKFLDFLMRPDIAAQNSTYVGYTTPNVEALKLMDKETVESEAYNPDLSKIKHLETYHDPRDVIELYENLWADLKAAK